MQWNLMRGESVRIAIGNCVHSVNVAIISFFHFFQRLFSTGQPSESKVGLAHACRRQMYMLDLAGVYI